MTTASSIYGPSAGLALIPLVAVCFATLILLAVVPARAGSALPPASLRGSLLGALTALLSTIGYAAYDSSGERVVLAASDVAMMLSPALLWIALRWVNGSPTVAIVAGSVAAVLMGSVSLAAPQEVAAGIKVALLVLFCAAAVWETRRWPLVTLRGALIVAVSVGAYATYSALRLIAGIAWGTDSAIWNLVFSTPLTTVMSAAVIIGCLAGFWRLRSATTPPAPTPRALAQAGTIALDAGRRVTVYRALLPVLAATRVAYGADAANIQRTSARDALSEAVPDAAIAQMTTGEGYVCLVTSSSDAPDAADATPAIITAYASRTGSSPLSAGVELMIERVEVRDTDTLARALDAPAS